MQPSNNYTIVLFIKETKAEYSLENGFNSIGRSRSNDINIKECKYMSRKQCTIYFNNTNQNLSITSHSNKCLTKINRNNESVPLNQNQTSPLYMGDIIRIASITLLLKYKKLDLPNQPINNNNNNNGVFICNNNINNSNISINNNPKTNDNFLYAPQNSPNINQNNPFSLYTKLINNNVNENNYGIVNNGHISPTLDSTLIEKYIVNKKTSIVKKVPRASLGNNSPAKSIDSLFSSLTIDSNNNSNNNNNNNDNSNNNNTSDNIFIDKPKVKKKSISKCKSRDISLLFDKISLNPTPDPPQNNNNNNNNNNNIDSGTVFIDDAFSDKFKQSNEINNNSDNRLNNFNTNINNFINNNSSINEVCSTNNFNNNNNNVNSNNNGSNDDNISLGNHHFENKDRSSTI